MMLQSHKMHIAAGVMGFSGLLAQMLLLRELLIVFTGNELSIGLILTGWLAAEALGALIGRRLTVRQLDDRTLQDRPQQDRPLAERPLPDSRPWLLRRYVLMAAGFGLALVPAIWLVRSIKPWLGISVGTVPGLGPVAGLGLLIMLPVGLTHGALFSLACGAAGDRAGRAQGDHSSSIYIMESAGTVIAGVVWTLVLVHWINAFQVAFGVLAINAALVVYLWRPAGARLQISPKAAALAGTAVLGCVVLAGVGSAWLQDISVAALWQNQQVVHYENSRHRNIVVTDNQGQFTFFTDGSPAFSMPEPDSDLVEALVHIPMIAHQQPERVLLIGGGAGGYLDAVLQHPSVRQVEYHELDPRMLQLQRDFAAGDAVSGIDDERVRARAVDSRVAIRGDTRGFDVIFSRYVDPANLHSSRYFSLEFFRLAARQLNEDGMLVLGFPGLVGHLNQPLQALAAVSYRGLQQYFPYVRAFPGGSESFLVASFDPVITVLDADAFGSRLRQRGMLDAVAVPWHIEQRLHPRWHGWFLDFVHGDDAGGSLVSRDFRPLALFLSLAHWSSLNAPVAGRVLEYLYTVHPVLIVLGVLLVLLVPVLLMTRRSPGHYRRVIPAVTGTGFSAMVMSLSLMFAFELLAGRLFGWLGLLTAAFIAGLGVGAWYSRRHSPRRMLIVTELAVLLGGAVLIVLPVTAAWAAVRLPVAVLRLVFLLLLLSSGAVCGAQFPAACGVLFAPDNNRTPDVTHKHKRAAPAGLVYAADLYGGCLGGLFGGILLVPLLGFTGTGITIVVLKACTLIGVTGSSYAVLQKEVV
ncbi:spermidine synthase [Spirochaeta africana]|uniref:Polyamine aminopropyltransferase n=1 Tax=Spirochaeta africana (strain ATCC 700263 / DSM 8902 / Z-7692) TaxID=889378 RepID=H9UHJ3_SPIAZ|nr:spermidine synthase [Spirochaeta africana]AFG36986.1 spermidine synthase [Spirochaeta africana DSM 8902]